MIRYDNAHLSDIAAITEMFQIAFPEALMAVFGQPRLPPAIIQDLFARIYHHEPYGFIVARDDNRLAGYVLVCSDRDRLWRDVLWRGTLFAMMRGWVAGRYRGLGVRFVPRLAKLGFDYWRAEKDPGAAEPFMAQVLSIVVGPSFKRQGIGRRMTEAALDYLRKTPAMVVRLEVDAAKDAPVRLYQKMGFQEISRLPTPRGPALVMTLDLK